MRIFLLTGLLSLSACVNSASDGAVCAGTVLDRKAHAAALVEDGGPLSQATGVRLLVKLDAGC